MIHVLAQKTIDVCQQYVLNVNTINIILTDVKDKNFKNPKMTCFINHFYVYFLHVSSTYSRNILKYEPFIVQKSYHSFDRSRFFGLMKTKELLKCKKKLLNR